MSDFILPNIEQAKVTLNEKGRVVVRMNDGYVFWDRNDYKDEKGEMYEPTPKEVGYSRFGIFSPTTDFSTFVVIAESEIPEIPDEPEEPETETQATETDCINALKELGGAFNE